MADNIYRKQVELLLRILPTIMSEKVFVLKGGTAINFFWRNYPRLSVDIDLTYTKVQDRIISLKDINDRLNKIAESIKRIISNVIINPKIDSVNRFVYALIIRRDDATVKVEVNTVIRGTVFPIVNKRLCEKAETEYELSLTANTLSFEDLYGGKICAALDRQHPRDLFDIKLLFENEGLTVGIHKAFIVYLISHNRPIVELLNPGLQDISLTFKNEFQRMTSENITLNELLSVRSDLIKNLKTNLTEDEIKFLLSFKNKEPEWNLLGLEQIEELPAIKYKMMNLEKMNPEKYKQAYDKLEDYLLK